jgi:hypothetical protein
MCRTNGPAEQIEIPDWDALIAGLGTRLALL